jgi:Mn-containing catalase
MTLSGCGVGVRVPSGGPKTCSGRSSDALPAIDANRRSMIQRFDQLAVDLAEPSGPNPAAAAAIQELMGGKFGEMSTLMNYTFQSFNFCGKEKYRPFYDLICNIAAEEYSHIEAAVATINLQLNGAVPRADRNKPFGEAADSKKKKAANKKHFGDANPTSYSDPAITAFYRYHFANSGEAAVPFNGMGNPWNGSYVTATGNLKMDLLHNFFLECGARAGKSRGV